MKPDKHLIGAVGIILAAIGLIAPTPAGALRAIQVLAPQNAALVISEQISHQLLALDQTLRMLVSAREINPDGFDLEAWRTRANVLSGISRDMVLTDGSGIVRQPYVIPAINADVAHLDVFRVLAEPGAPLRAMFIEPAIIGASMPQWHLNVATPLHARDGSFAGLIDADAIQRGESGGWTGPSATDPARRIHAYRRIPDRPLVLLAAMDETDAMRPAAIFSRQAEIFAGCTTLLLAGLAALLVNGSRLGRLRERAMADDKARLAAANAQLEVARAQVTAKAERLEATLAGMTDGVSMFDGHLCLVEWNARFPEIAGVPVEMLRVGLPMEDVLRAQIASGQFGHVTDPEDEVERRIARMRETPYGVVQRPTPDGRTLELRRKELPDGGFVTLYSDVSSHKQIEGELLDARAEAEAANAAKSRFVAVVSHEIRTPLNTLLNTMRLLHDGGLSPQRQSLLALARQSGDVLSGLINDILEMSQMEAGKLVIRPSLFDLRQMLDNSVEVFALQGAERGITLGVAVAEGTPVTLLTDPGRLRQVLLNLLSNALKYARPGNVWLTAEPGGEDSRAVIVMVKDSGPMIAEPARERLFRPFSRLDRPDSEDLDGTGLGLSICRHLMTLMGGEIGCDPWVADDGRTGNGFWISLPATALPSQGADDTLPQAAIPAATRTVQAPHAPDIGISSEILPQEKSTRAPGLHDPRRQVPRTRVLLADDVLANQLVTATLLRREGHMVDVVASGQAAVNALRRIPYDLVFMDIFMPGMGGQEATRSIRSLPEPACLTPIIALTADVTPEHEAVFKSSGMDGALVKPVSLAELLDALHTHVWSAPRQDATPAVPAEALFQPAPHDPWAVLSHARIRELRTTLPPEIFVNLVEQCLSDLVHRLPALRLAVTSGNPGAITTHAHAMVGMAAGYGMAALEARLRTILAAARDGDTLTLSGPVVAEVEGDLTEATRMLREVSKSEVV